MSPHGMASETAAQERVFIFGNSTHNFVEIIRSWLDFDISCYANIKLLICKAVLQAAAEI